MVTIALIMLFVLGPIISFICMMICLQTVTESTKTLEAINAATKRCIDAQTRPEPQPVFMQRFSLEESAKEN